MKSTVIKKNNSKKIIIIFTLVIFSLAGAVRVLTSFAAPQFQPIGAGLNFQAGWGSHSVADNEKIIDAAAAAGIKWLRIDIGWATIEETGDAYGGMNDPRAAYTGPCVQSSSDPGCWYYGKIDKAVDYARSKGLQVMGIWWCTPPWNTDGGTGKPPYTRPAGYPTYPEYAESIEWAAKHWSGRIDHWEIWNESDPGQAFWVKPDGTKHTLAEANYYAELLKVAYPAVKRGNPNAKVLNSGPSSVDVAYMQKLYDLGIKNYFDIMAVHPYEGPANADPLSSNGTQVWQFLHIPALRQLMVNQGDTDKPMWFTELGFSTHTNEDLDGGGVASWHLGVTEQQQGEYLVKALDYAKKNWPYVEVFIIYNDRDRETAGGEPDTQRHQKYFGLLRPDHSPKPGMITLGQYLNSQPQPPTTYPDIDANMTNTSLSQVFNMQNPPANEASGIVVSQGMYLVHNDSGGTANLYAFNKSSQLIATINVPGASAIDWEDIVVVPNASGDDIWVADIGNNAGTRTNLKLYKFNIPSIDKTKLNQSITAQNVVSYPISYSDRNNDAETLAIHPTTKKLYIVSKRGTPYIYESPATLSTTNNNVFQVKNPMPVQYATAGDISKDGKYFVVTNSNPSDTARIWNVTNGDVLGAITSNPAGQAITPPALSQLEGVTFTPDSKHIVFNTEYGTPSPVWAMPNPLYSTSVSADLDKNGKVNIIDLSMLLNAWGTNNPNFDLQPNGTIDIQDLAILLSKWGNT